VKEWSENKEFLAVLMNVMQKRWKSKYLKKFKQILRGIKMFANEDY